MEIVAEESAPSKTVKRDEADEKLPVSKRKRRWFRVLTALLLLMIVVGVIARIAAPPFVRWYVNRTLDQNPLYDGTIGDVQIHLWRGAYSIENISISKVTGSMPVPLFSAKRVDLALQWDALMNGKIVARVVMQSPELNFVDAGDASTSQTGVGGPWLDMLSDLFPFKINKTVIENGSIHFRAYDRKPAVDLFINQLYATIDNLTNIKDESTPLLATVTAKGLAMEQAQFEYKMKFDPFSYRPTFELAVRLLGLNVTKLNEFARAYGGIDFERGFFDLVVEVQAREGFLQGYVKPLFRKLIVLSPKDVKEDNALQLFWETVVGVTELVLKNQSRDQLATVIPLSGEMTTPSTNIGATLVNVLRNAFIRAYLPKLQGITPDINHLEFGKGSITDPSSIGAD